PAHHPGGEDQVRITDRVIGVHMREKGGRDVGAAWAESGDAFLEGSSGAPDYTGTKIDQIRHPPGDDRGRGAGPRRIRTRRSSAEHDHLRRGFFRLHVCFSLPRRHCTVMPAAAMTLAHSLRSLSMRAFASVPPIAAISMPWARKRWAKSGDSRASRTFVSRSAAVFSGILSGAAST